MIISETQSLGSLGITLPEAAIKGVAPPWFKKFKSVEDAFKDIDTGSTPGKLVKDEVHNWLKYGIKADWSQAFGHPSFEYVSEQLLKKFGGSDQKVDLDELVSVTKEFGLDLPPRNVASQPKEEGGGIKAYDIRGELEDWNKAARKLLETYYLGSASLGLPSKLDQYLTFAQSKSADKAALLKEVRKLYDESAAIHNKGVRALKRFTDNDKEWAKREGKPIERAPEYIRVVNHTKLLLDRTTKFLTTTEDLLERLVPKRVDEEESGNLVYYLLAGVAALGVGVWAFK